MINPVRYPQSMRRIAKENGNSLFTIQVGKTTFQTPGLPKTTANKLFDFAILLSNDGDAERAFKKVFKDSGQ